MVSIPGAIWLDSKNVENKLLGKYFRRIQCPTCNIIIYEEFEYGGKQLSNFYEEHYNEDHVECKNDPDSCDCDKNSCGRRCGR